MAGAEADEALVRAPVPVEGEPQRLAIGVELERNPAIVDHRHPQRRGPTTLERHPEHYPVGPTRLHLTPHGPLDRRELLGGEHPLGELDEMVVDRAVRDPQAAGPKQPLAVSPDGQGERAQRQLHAERTMLEQDLLVTNGSDSRHRLAWFSTSAPSPCPVHRMVTGRVRSFFTDQRLFAGQSSMA